MPVDTTTSDYAALSSNMETETDRSLPAGAGLALGVIMGSVIWAGLIALFFLL